MIKSRKERRKEAKANKQAFKPKYNGNGLVTHEEHYGIGYERFNGKHVTIKGEENNDDK